MSDKEKVASRYDKWTYFYDLIDDFPLISRPQKIWRQKAVEALKIEEKDLILDIGTASGKMLPMITSQFDEGKVIGTDISRKMLLRAEKLIEKNDLEDKVEIKFDDIEKSSFPDDHFDKIISTFTFTTLPNPKKSALECSRILKDGGKMIVLDTGWPEKIYSKILFVPIMISAKVFGRTHMDRDIIAILKNNFKIRKISTHMSGMVYIIECIK